jgi:soluble lytic murein transglycosylase-like protein
MGSKHRCWMNLWLLGVALSIAVLSYSCATQHPPSPVPPPSPPPVIPTTPVPDLQTTYQSILQGDTIEKRREIFRLAYLSFQKKDRLAARLFFSRALEVYPALADYSLYYLALIQRADGRYYDAQVLFLRLLVDYPDSTWTSYTTLELASLALEHKQWDEAIRYAQHVRSGATKQASVRHSAAVILAQAYEGQRDLLAAYQQYQEVRHAAPHSQAAKTAKERVEALRAADPDRFAPHSAQEYLTEMRLRSQEGDAAGVATLTTQFDMQFPDSSSYSEALTLLADTYKRQGKREEAIRVWQEITARYSDSTAGVVALSRCATQVWNADRNDEALQLFERITQQYPRHSQAADAWYAIGRIHQERKADAQATAAFERLATLFPGSQLAREGRWRQAWMAYRREDFADAGQRFAVLARSAGNTAEGESALYWQARALEKQGQQAAESYQTIIQRYPDSYYAFLAEKRLGVSPSPLSSSDIDVGPFAPPMLATAAAHYQRSLELRAIGLSGFARRELDVVRDSTPREPAYNRFFLNEYDQVEGHHAALRFAQTLARGSGNWIRYLYPQAYWTTVSDQARAKQLDPYLVLALMRQESVFDPDAVSPAQAYGLMQLLPTTAAKVAGVEAGTLLPLTDPQFNIETGTAYLQQLLDRYKGNTIQAIAAYNSGENAVDRWLKRYPGLAEDEFVEHISYRETRNYVKQVLKNYRTYQRLYGNESARAGG